MLKLKQKYLHRHHQWLRNGFYHCMYTSQLCSMPKNGIDKVVENEGVRFRRVEIFNRDNPDIVTPNLNGDKWVHVAKTGWIDEVVLDDDMQVIKVNNTGLQSCIQDAIVMCSNFLG